MADTPVSSTGAQPQATHRFGELAVALGLLTPAQLATALTRQEELRAGGAKSRLGETCLLMKLLDLEQVRKVLSEQRKLRQHDARMKLPQEQFGDYKLIRRIGEGGMGTVYEARHAASGASVALKVMRKGLGLDRTFIERFDREMKASTRLLHPHVVQTLDCGTHKGIQFLAMEFVDGETFKTTIELEGQVQESKAVQVALAVAKALSHAHKLGLVHRDIKPENILLGHDGAIKLADLGLAKSVHDEKLTQTGEVVGSPNYIAPEQARGQREPDPRSDLYALGATLYHALTGKQPFGAATPMDALMLHVKGLLAEPRTLNPRLSAPLAAVLVKLMAKDPAERYQTAAELIEDLEALQRSEAPRHAAHAPRYSTVDTGTGAMKTATVSPAGKQGCFARFTMLAVMLTCVGLCFLWVCN